MNIKTSKLLSTEEPIIRHIEERKRLFGTVRHERLGMRVVDGALRSERIQEIAVADLDDMTIHRILAAKEIEIDVLINREPRRDYHVRPINEIAIDRLELGSGEEWVSREGTGTLGKFYVLDSWTLSQAKSLILKYLTTFVKLRDGGFVR